MSEVSLETPVRETQTQGLLDQMRALGTRARDAARALATATPETKCEALRIMAREIRAAAAAILAANAEDMEKAAARGLSAAMLDRLKLDEPRVEAIARAVEEIADQTDPVGAVMDAWERPNGLKIERVRVPLGVIGIIYESRPNVTADAGALCVKAGNAVILRGGSESARSSAAIHACLARGLDAAGLPADAVQIVPTTDRAAVGILLADMADLVDVIVPRGGKTLVARVQAEARVPVLAHLEGLCHVYVDKGADLEKAKAIAVNSKMRRVGICGAAETLLLDRALDAADKKAILGALLEAGCTVRGDRGLCALDPRLTPASEDDWRTEYLEPIIAAREVDGVEGAAEHIRTYGSQHTDAIVTEDAQAAERFLHTVDSAIVLWNASTQFADGGEFGMGAEIGISTGKLHARGPVGVEQLTSFKYVVRGSGQTRP